MINSRLSNLVIFLIFYLFVYPSIHHLIVKILMCLKEWSYTTKTVLHVIWAIYCNPDCKSGVDEDGQRLPPLNGTGHTWHHSPDQLFQIIRYGYKKFDPNYKGKMLGNEDLSEDDVWSILGYIKSIWPEEIQISIILILKNNKYLFQILKLLLIINN